MTDRELLSLAAKAVGVTGLWVDAGLNTTGNAAPVIWNPLEDDGDALRLAVKLGIAVQLHPGWVYARAVPPDRSLIWLEITEGWAHTKEPWKEPYAATRRAIVRAAAELGKNMP